MEGRYRGGCGEERRERREKTYCSAKRSSDECPARQEPVYVRKGDVSCTETV
jgi:hypothetical protein